MMKIRSIGADERVAFARYTDHAEHNTQLAQYVADRWTEATSRPAWCFVAEDEGQIVGRVMYWALPGSAIPCVVDFLDVPWTDNYLEVGEALLRDTLARFARQGATTVRYEITLPSRFSTHPEKRIEILERVGFTVRREGDRWEWTAGAAPAVPSGRIVFRAWPEVGEEEFIGALGRTLEGTLDRWLQRERQTLGAGTAAREYVAAAQTLQHKPDWWHLAYTPDGALIGVIMACANDGGPIIDYVGVVPEQRGHGYVDDLLAQGVAVLQTAGATRIRADSDKLNLPMAAAFRRAGFRAFSTRVVYSIDLAGWDADG
jgi:ribosomal protein S18 acetylase RimI-like enzyme